MRVVKLGLYMTASPVSPIDFTCWKHQKLQSCDWNFTPLGDFLNKVILYMQTMWTLNVNVDNEGSHLVGVALVFRIPLMLNKEDIVCYMCTSTYTFTNLFDNIIALPISQKLFSFKIHVLFSELIIILWRNAFIIIYTNVFNSKPLNNSFK